MKTIKLHELSDDPTHYATLARTLENGGLICVPCRGTYRILADLFDPKAVTGLMQSKRRTGTSPSLVFIADAAGLNEVADEIDPIALNLANELWPGPLTILFEPTSELPRKVTKQVARANGKIGVRVPSDDIVQRIIAEFGGPVLASSANREKKSGASSPAQVRKNFVSRVDFFVDAGDLPGAPSSTIVSVENGELVITREGAVDSDLIRAAV